MARKRKKSPFTGVLHAWTPASFIAQNPVFSLADIREAYRLMGRNPDAARETVAYHLANKTIILLRRGLYAHATNVNPVLLGSRLTPDALVAYQGALEFHGLIIETHVVHVVTAKRPPPLVFNEVIYEAIRAPERLRAGGALDKAVVQGQPVNVTRHAVTLVDCLDRLDLSPPLATLWGFFQNLKTFDWDDAWKHWVALGRSPLLASRLGVFLSTNRFLNTYELGRFEKASLQQPAYFNRAKKQKGDAIVSRWNLIIPDELAELRAQSQR